MSLSIWHPFTQHGLEASPLTIVRGEAALIYDDKGKSYIDAISSWWTTLHGHAHPRLNEALYQQAQTLEHTMFSGFTHPPALALAHALGKATDESFSHIFFSDNGSTAVEVALKMAVQYWQNKGESHRHIFLAFEGGYHGDTFGAMAVGRGSGFFTPFEGLLPEVILLPYAPTWEGDDTILEKEALALARLTEVLDHQSPHIAALILEPLVQGAGGMRMCRPEFIQAITTLLQERGILTIFDEVAVGFGRTGSLFAFQQCGVVPDFLCLAKGLTGGYMPMSVTLSKKGIYEAFLGSTFDKAFAHGHSFTANPLACAVAGESLKMLLEPEAQAKIQTIMHFYEEAKPALKASSRFEKVRSRGTILAFDFTDPECSAYKSTRSEQWRRFFYDQGINLRPLGKTLYLLPPYCLEKTHFDHILKTLLSDQFSDMGS
jgi:adenosylmethionine---8-amino-7-oxononanoate aminotransferase